MHIAGVHDYVIWQGTRNALILEALCFQKKRQHFPWAANTFYGKFHFAVNSASNKNSFKNILNSSVHIQATGTVKA